MKEKINKDKINKFEEKLKRKRKKMKNFQNK